MPMRTQKTGGGITLSTGQAVLCPPAAMGVAQVEELRRTCVRLVYRCGTGLLRRPIVSVRRLASLQRREGETPPLPAVNLLGRGMIRRTKTFEQGGDDADQ